MSSCQLGASLQIDNDSRIFDTLAKFQRAYAPIHPYLGAFICVTGVFMNVASVIVLTRPTMIVSPINCLLTVIAVCDAVTMLSYFNYLIRLVTFPNCPSMYTYEWMVTILINSNITVVGHTVSIWLTVSMAIIRACTVKQAWGGAVRTTKAPTLAVFITVPVFLTVCMLNMPSALTYTVVELPLTTLCRKSFNFSTMSASMYNSTAMIFLYTTRISKLAELNDCRIFKLAFWMNGVLFKMLPCILLSVFIGVLIFILAEVRRRRVRLRLTNDAHRTDKTTLMLIVLLTVFLLSELPQGILLICTGIFDNQFRSKVSYKLGDLMDLLSLINSSANFVIYFAMSQKFREVFCRTLLPIIGDYRIIYTDNRLTFYATEGATEMALRTMNGNGHRPSRVNLDVSQASKGRNSVMYERSQAGGRNSMFERSHL